MAQADPEQTGFINFSTISCLAARYHESFSPDITSFAPCPFEEQKGRELAQNIPWAAPISLLALSFWDPAAALLIGTILGGCFAMNCKLARARKMEEMEVVYGLVKGARFEPTVQVSDAG